MAPSKSPAKVSNRDIRGFFGSGSGTNSQGMLSASSSGSRGVDAAQSSGKDAHQKPGPQKRKKHAVLISSDDEDEDTRKESPPKKKQFSGASSSKPKPATTVSTKGAKNITKTKSAVSLRADAKYIMISSEGEEDGDDDYVEEDDTSPTKGKSKAEKSKKKQTEKPAQSKAVHKSRPSGKIQDDIKPQDQSEPKFNWAAAKAARLAGPSAPGSKEIPAPASPDCLAGLSFVFTGELSSLSRDEATELAKRHGGRVTLQPSSKTSYVVVGSDAGPKKLAAIKEKKLRTLDEDGFLNLIATRVLDESQIDEKTKKKKEKEAEAIRQAAKEMEKREKTAIKQTVAKSGKSHVPDASSQLWTDRYAPQTLKEICGNKGQVEKLQSWLHDWSSSLKSGFKKPGKNGMNIFRAVLITGPPGIGKTTSAHLCAKLEGFTPIELNASDARSKKLVENSTNIANTSLDGWMAGDQMTNAAGVAITDKSCLIMDEVDGMSAGDRGGVGALASLIRKTKIPIICIANDRNAPKLKPLVHATYNLTYRRPEASAIRSRLLSVAFKEKMKIPANVIDELVTGSQSDIRQVLNMMSTWKLSSTTMNFDEGKALAKMNEKYATMTPFNAINKLLGPYMFSPTSRETLNDKMELYFHDHSFMPLFVQENYLKTQPSKLKNFEGPEKTLKHLQLMYKAAASVSDGDLVDNLIHGSEQHWSLMPLHAVCSSVRPASFLYGMGAAYGGPNAMSFPQWLGQNSKQGKLTRQLTDIQARLRVKVSGDKADIRQSYLPALFPHIVQPLMDRGTSAIDEVIERMDEYFLTKEDWDTVVELGLDGHKDDIVLKKIPSATKASFTRKYNSQDHPVPFHKAQDLGKAPKKIAAQGPLPDLEEAFDVDEEDGAVEDNEEKAVSSDDDIAHDSLIKAPKKKATNAKGKGKAK